MPHPSGLTDEQVREVQDLWHNRPTIASLAWWFRISEDMVRKIIAMPYEREEE